VPRPPGAQGRRRTTGLRESGASGRMQIRASPRRSPNGEPLQRLRPSRPFRPRRRGDARSPRIPT